MTVFDANLYEYGVDILEEFEDIIYEELEVNEIIVSGEEVLLKSINKRVISEISLKIIVNGEELVSLLCLNQFQQELAIGFLYNEGVIESYEDIENISYNERMFAVIIQLKQGVIIDRQESLRSVTSGCGKCYTYINPLKKSKFNSIKYGEMFNIRWILDKMNSFGKQSEVFKSLGGVHSVLFYTENYQIFNEDIGRHNCFDKITGLLIKNSKLSLAEKSVVFVSGRISSEIMAKIVRLGVPVLVSRTTPTTAAVKLAREYNITVMGYVRGDKGVVYSCPQRLT